MMELFVFLLVIAVTFLVWRARKVGRELASAKKALYDLEIRLSDLREAKEQLDATNAASIRVLTERAMAAEQDRDSLAQFKHVRDVSLEAQRLIAEASDTVSKAQKEASDIVEGAKAEASKLAADATADARAKRTASEQMLSRASTQAAKVIEDAQQRAKEIAGDAMRALEDADKLEAISLAMRNVIEGYGDRYMIPAHSVLDELAEAYSFAEAGKQLKVVREYSNVMVAQGRAATCEYVENNRRVTAIRFVVDAFNGKVDSILSRVKVDNVGTLQQEIKDAAALVNHNGTAFRNARILKEYIDARIDELVWASRTIELRENEKEEQRRIREQMREEERARREYERAMRDAEKEEAMLRKAMEKAQQQIARASEEQKAQFEQQLAELEDKLKLAEEKNQRALSMAQQTKAGHVYVISNIGSFGEHVYKVGLTRRLDPHDRVRELGDASVPFPFDVHAMIWSDNAPALETLLHRKFVEAQVNKINPRKEFFRVGIADLRQTVSELGLNVSWTMSAAAAEFRETQAIERQLQADPVLRDKWFRQQLAYEARLALEGETGEDGNELPARANGNVVELERKSDALAPTET
ncbi:conserved hypothetical protein [Cupriavidus taiwanensis]|uniref:DUF4041 domain-containing protein n=1 Tax=Cupriavidus taiwanensis TaxID=164546 RepID=UPI000E1A1AC3|nr:DUF4041 domain-containing protein [Cupriavidus taiwanensis]SOY93393.1 conserved hypothetical protein [Cupriavidus taiwanensis]SOY96359.1 conserved hypothetical protein [Cupriavidus taiwanensis]